MAGILLEPTQDFGIEARQGFLGSSRPGAVCAVMCARDPGAVTPPVLSTCATQVASEREEEVSQNYI